MHQDGVLISGNCGLNEAVATLVLSWPKKDPLYVFTMEFKRLEAASPSSNVTSNMTSWMVPMITFNVTLKNNPNLNFPLGKLYLFPSSLYFNAGHVVVLIMSDFILTPTALLVS